MVNDRERQNSVLKLIEFQNPLDIVVRREDRQVLRELGSRIAEIGALPIQQKRRGMWTRLNKLDAVKPMIWINNIPWHEMNVDDELVIRTGSPFCQRIEAELRQILYRWKHMPCDMVVEPAICSPLAVHVSGIGLETEEDIIKTDEDSNVFSHRFHRIVENEDDIQKIEMPVITHNEAKTEEDFQAYEAVFDGVLPVKRRGFPGFGFSPFDHLIKLTGVQQALLDLSLRPKFIHKLMDRLTSAYLRALDQFESLSLLALNNYNGSVGSGAYGYTDELPQSDFEGKHVRTIDIWGCATTQIFSEVSPEMHEEFALDYERRWLDRFGLGYYGCCEPLFMKMKILKKIPNLRKISVSPWNDMEKMAEQMAGDYVFSHKPNPAILAPDSWNPGLAREELESMLQTTRKKGCHVETIMKDISTVRYQPQRLWEWARIATEVTERFGQAG